MKGKFWCRLHTLWGFPDDAHLISLLLLTPGCCSDVIPPGCPTILLGLQDSTGFLWLACTGAASVAINFKILVSLWWRMSSRFILGYPSFSSKDRRTSLCLLPVHVARFSCCSNGKPGRGGTCWQNGTLRTPAWSDVCAWLHPGPTVAGSWRMLGWEAGSNEILQFHPTMRCSRGREKAWCPVVIPTGGLKGGVRRTYIEDQYNNTVTKTTPQNGPLLPDFHCLTP